VRHRPLRLRRAQRAQRQPLRVPAQPAPVSGGEVIQRRLQHRQRIIDADRSVRSHSDHLPKVALA
jgi:hypothetical protein